MAKNIKQTILMIPMVLASLTGIIISIILAAKKIDFEQILKIRITDMESIGTIWDIFEPWYICSFLCLLIALVVIMVYGLLKYTILKKRVETDELNLLDSLVISVVILFITQIVLPLISIVLILAFLILYAFFGVSSVLQYVLRFITQGFIWILQNLFTSIGVDIEFGNFIGQEYVSIFLTLILFLILTPYLFSGVLQILKHFIAKISKANGIIDLTFKPIEFIFKLIHVRYFIYFVLFLISILTYSYTINNLTNWLVLVKESLLAFVLLDTICYSIYDNHCKRKRLKESKLFLKLIVPYKLDLEYIRSIMTTYGLKNNKTGQAKIIFSQDVSILNMKKKPHFHSIVFKLQSLNGKLMTYEELYTKTNEILYCIYLYESSI